MAGEDIPIDYLSDRLKNVEVTVIYESGKGFFGTIKFDGTRIYKSELLNECMQEAFDNACKKLENDYDDLLQQYKSMHDKRIRLNYTYKSHKKS